MVGSPGRPALDSVTLVPVASDHSEPAQLRRQIRARITRHEALSRACTDSFYDCLANLIQTGWLLEDAFALVASGQWKAWVGANLPFGPDRARRLRRLASCFKRDADLRAQIAQSGCSGVNQLLDLLGLRPVKPAALPPAGREIVPVHGSNGQTPYPANTCHYDERRFMHSRLQQPLNRPQRNGSGLPRPASPASFRTTPDAVRGPGCSRSVFAKSQLPRRRLSGRLRRKHQI